MRSYYVHILTNYTRSVLYIGVTNNLERRLQEHRLGEVDGFTRRYNCKYLIFYEEGTSIEGAIAREKQLKGWRRSKKEKLIEVENPEWKDLSENCNI